MALIEPWRPDLWKRKPTKNKNPYMEETVESEGSHGVKSETRVLNDLGAQKQIGSGAFDGMKSDGLKSVGEMDFQIECKATRKESFSFKYSTFRKIRDEATEMGRVPLLTISFTYGDGKSKPGGDWVCMPAWLFKELCDDDNPES